METEQHNINYSTQQTSIQLLAQQIGNLAGDIRELRAEISFIKRPNITAFIGAATLLIGLASGLWWFAVNMAINPIREHVDEKFLELARQQSALQDQFTKLADRSELNRQIIEQWLKRNARPN